MSEENEAMKKRSCFPSMYRICLSPSDLHSTRHRPLPRGICPVNFIMNSFYIGYELLISAGKMNPAQ